MYFLQTLLVGRRNQDQVGLTTAFCVKNISCLQRVILEDQGACCMKHTEARKGWTSLFSFVPGLPPQFASNPLP